MAHDSAQLSTEAPMGSQERITGNLRAHAAIAQDKVRQDREDRFTRRTLESPDGEPTQPDTHIMGVAGQAPAATTARVMGELKTQGQEESHNEFDKRLAVAKQLKIGRFVLK